MNENYIDNNRYTYYCNLFDNIKNEYIIID